MIPLARQKVLFKNTISMLSLGSTLNDIFKKLKEYNILEINFAEDFRTSRINFAFVFKGKTIVVKYNEMLIDRDGELLSVPIE